MKSVSQHIQAQIAELAQQGKSTRQIADLLDVSQSTVSRYTKKDRVAASPTTHCGRLKILDHYDEQYVSRLVQTGKCTTASQIKQELRDFSGIFVSADTILRTLRRLGYRSHLKKKRPQLTKTHRAARRTFERTHRNWKFEDWGMVIWSDETKINLWGSDGGERCFRRAGEPLRDHQVIPTRKFGGGSIMVWGCMLASGIGFLCRVDGGLNAEVYKNILEDDLQQTIDWYGLDKASIFFQQDNASCHKANSVIKWLHDAGIKLIKWPAQSPDLNPTEHLWDLLKTKLHQGSQPRDLEDLWNKVQDVWNSITTEECRKLVASMPQRLKEVQRAKGGHIRY